MTWPGWSDVLPLLVAVAAVQSVAARGGMEERHRSNPSRGAR